MSLESNITAEIKQAMLARKKEDLEALRAIKSSLLLLKTSPDVLAAGGEITEAQENAMLQKMVKQRKETAAIYVGQHRQELADVELAQAAVIERFLPKQLDRADVEKAVKEIIAQVGATSMKDMGRVMGLASKQLAGQADNKLVSEIVKAALSQQQ